MPSMAWSRSLAVIESAQPCSALANSTASSGVRYTDKASSSSKNTTISMPFGPRATPSLHDPTGIDLAHLLLLALLLQDLVELGPGRLVVRRQLCPLRLNRLLVHLLLDLR